MRLLLVEDETRVASFIAKGLEGAGYITDVVGTGAEALERLRRDQAGTSSCSTWASPTWTGSRCWEVRKTDQVTPIIMLTARGDVPSRVKGLDLGADDYLPKPFDFDELVARIRAQLRHDRQQHGSVLQAGDLTLDLKARRALRGDRAFDLTSREFALLEFFLRHQGQVLTRSQILNGVWGYDFDPQTNVVDVYVGYLRGKLDEPGRSP